MTSVRMLSILFAVGCNFLMSCKEDAAPSCSAYYGQTQVRYAGNAIGWGKLSLETSNDEDAPLHATLDLEDESGSGASFHLSGVGTCRDGILRLRLAGFDDPTQELKILGGSIVAVIDHELEDGLFGSWRVEVIGPGFEEPTELKGFLREEDERWVSVSAPQTEVAAGGTGPS